jgi:galactokinase
MCDIFNNTSGVLGSQLVGAGLGGCVIALVEKDKAENIIAELNEKYYDKYNLSRSAAVYSPSCGSSVIY